LTIDGESLRYEWNRYSKQWKCQNDSEMDSISSDTMDDFFAQPGAGLLRVSVWVNNQLLLEFKFNPEERRWEVEDFTLAEAHLDADFMREMVSMPMKGSQARGF
jgi:hypothetical protein